LNPPLNNEFQAEIVNFPYSNKIVYLFRLKKKELVIRLGSVPITSGEIWYLRLLIRNTYPTKFEDLYSFNNVRYETFQECCVARGLLNHENEAQIAFEEALVDSSPPELRSFFVLLSLQGFPTLKIFNDPNHKNSLRADLNNENELLIDLNERFNRENKNMEDYGLPPPMV
jgi:hypothetical protein